MSTEARSTPELLASIVAPMDVRRAAAKAHAMEALKRRRDEETERTPHHSGHRSDAATRWTATKRRGAVTLSLSLNAQRHR